MTTDCDRYLDERLQSLENQLATVERLAGANDLPEAIITESGLKITPLDAAVPEAAQALDRPDGCLCSRASRSPNCSWRWTAWTEVSPGTLPT